VDLNRSKVDQNEHGNRIRDLRPTLGLNRDLVFAYYFLLGHQLARVLVHLRIMYTQTAEYGERLEDGHITLAKLTLVLLQLTEQWILWID
jgi:hypothetical protein